MTASQRMRTTPKAFTLVELSIVIVIILILVALLLPAINSAIKRSKETQQFNEISQLSLALESFKEKYGVYPPSRIRLRENTNYHLNSAHPDYQLDAHSVQYLKRMFPNITLPTDNVASGGNGPINPAPFNWFNDGVVTTYELEGDECLVFFLGGIADTVSSAGSIIQHGFAKNPANPSGIPTAGSPLSQSREVPLFTFDQSRLFIRNGDDVENAGTRNQDLGVLTEVRPPKLPSYRSIISPSGNNKPIAYFSSYEGKGYRPHDCNIPDKFQTEKRLRSFQITWPTISVKQPASRTDPQGHATDSLGPNPYLEFDPLYPVGMDPATQDADTEANVTARPLVKAYKADGYQLITAGPDGLYGTGGILRGDRYSNSDPDYDNISNVGDGRSVGSFASGLK